MINCASHSNNNKKKEDRIQHVMINCASHSNSNEKKEDRIQHAMFNCASHSNNNKKNHNHNVQGNTKTNHRNGIAEASPGIGFDGGPCPGYYAST